MIKMNKQFWKKISVALVVGVGILIGVPAAIADTGGGIGGGGSNGNLRGNVHWTSIANDQKGVAWDQFIGMEKAADRTESWVTEQVIARVNHNTVCQDSRVIWYLKHDSSSRWVYNYSLETHGQAWDDISINAQNSDIENPSEVKGDRPANAAEITAFKNWDKKTNGNLIDKKPGYVIICSGSFDEQIVKPDIEEPYTEEKSDSQSLEYTFNEIRSYKTDIAPQLNEYDKDGNSVDLIGQNNLNVQSTGNSRTNYGVALDNILEGNNKDMNVEATKKTLEAAIAKDKARDINAPVNLNAKNKAGMAEGGILNIDERTSKAKITLTREDSIKETRKCVKSQKWNVDSAKYDPIVIKCEDWVKTVTNGVPEVNKDLPTQQQTGFWQMISVHCNPKQFNDLLNIVKGETKVNQGSVRENIAAAATTKSYKQQPTVLDFGDPDSNSVRKFRSSQLAFYDKECPFDCTPSASKANGASDKNGATGNVATGENSADSFKGAYSNDVNSNQFDFFRDNEQKNLKVNVWYPKEAGVNYDGAAPKTTTVTRWEQGTPGIAGDGGRFTMKTKDGETLFGGTGSPTNQKNWSTDTFNAKNSTSLPGLHNEFTVQSTWASEKDKPQKLNVKYEYAPTVNTTLYTEGLGFSKGNDGTSIQRLGTTETVSAVIEGKCYVNYTDTKNQIDTTKSFGDNTGTGTTNDLDGSLVEGSGKDKATNLTVNFVRATAE